jgi:hypothetical protein
MISPQDLSNVEIPFSHEEINNIIKRMPNDKAPGPDGFNGLFMRKFWNIMKHPFYNMCSKFYAGNLELSNINTAYITLIPKISCPAYPSDYRPISLVTMALKVLTKLIANRVQDVIIPLVHSNQYGFIKSRTIQDCIAWAFEYLYIFHKSKKEIIIIKLDFETAFDLVEHNAVLAMLRHMRFGEKFISWINNILTTLPPPQLFSMEYQAKISNVRGGKARRPIISSSICGSC